MKLKTQQQMRGDPENAKNERSNRDSVETESGLQIPTADFFFNF